MHGWCAHWPWLRHMTSWTAFLQRAFPSRAVVAQVALAAGWLLLVSKIAEGLPAIDNNSNNNNNNNPFFAALRKGKALHQRLLSHCDALPLRTSSALSVSSALTAYAVRPSLPVGLKNLKNTCYMNAVLQSLFSVKEFSEGITLKAFDFTRDSLGEEVVSLFQRMHGDEQERKKRFRVPIRPSSLAEKLKIDVRVQEDAEELLLKILNGLDESVKSGKKKKTRRNKKKNNSVSSPSPSESSLTTNEETDSDTETHTHTAATSASEDTQQEKMPSDTTQSASSPPPLSLPPVNCVDSKSEDRGKEVNNDKEKEKETDNDIAPTAAVRLELQQTMRCVTLDHISSQKLSTHFDLSVEIKDCLSLDEAIKQYFTPELLTGANKYKCNVHGLQDAEKSLRISKFPRVLITHLKRFSFDPVSYNMKKIVDPVDIPLSLDLTPYAAPELARSLAHDATTGRYSLQAAIVHEGSLDFGHYYAFAKVPLFVDGKEQPISHWVKLNDDEVTLVDEETVLKVTRGGKTFSKNPRNMLNRVMGDAVSTNAYILLYTQWE